MRKNVYDNRGEKLLKHENAEPICGEDFCDTCGDCLHCYGDSPCADQENHHWVQYGKDNVLDLSS